jgi:hypothetical protein
MSKQPTTLIEVKVTFRCSCGPETEDRLPDFYVEGGCNTDHGLDYCYCRPQETRVRVRCKFCKKEADLLVQG